MNQEIKFLDFPKMIAQWSFDNGRSVCAVSYYPNRWVRFWQKFILGITWKKL